MNNYNNITFATLINIINLSESTKMALRISIYQVHNHQANVIVRQS